MRSGCTDHPKWTRPADCCDDICTTADLTALLDEAWVMASQFGYDLTGHQFPGSCPAEVFPCPPCGCEYLCQCGGPFYDIDLGEAFCYEILPDTNGDALVQVAVGDTIVDPSTYELLGDGITLRFCTLPGQAGPCSEWPEQKWCGTRWSVRATVGAEPPGLLLRGLAKFACELVKECSGQESCLPDRVRSITRRGLTMDVGSELAETIDFDNDGTGIPMLDVAINTYGMAKQSTFAAFDPIAAQLDREGSRTGSYSFGRYGDYGHAPNRIGGSSLRRRWSFTAPFNPTPIA